MPRFQTTIFYLLFLCCFTMYIGYLSLKETPQFKLFQREINSFLTKTLYDNKNNFLAFEDHIYSNLLVNTTNCIIPKFDPYDPMVIPYVEKAEWVENCPQQYYSWTYRNETRLVFNETALKNDGYSFKDLSCCYMSVERDEQSDNPEEAVIYSPCHSVKTTEVELKETNEEFIVVECSANLLLTTVYRGFHSIPQKFRSEVTRNKVKYWKNKLKFSDDPEPPPNVIFVGTDSTSALNFQRNMIKTYDILTELGATPMQGYTKCGEGTRSAFTVMFSGYTHEELDVTCHTKSSAFYDSCPFIWQRFNDANYLTAHSEDWPDLYALNPGFNKQPVDYYLRTLMNAAHDYGLPYPVNKFVRLSTQWCLGYQTNDEILVDYTEGLLDMATQEKVPLFALLWSDTYPHNRNHNFLQLLDETYYQFLKRLSEKQILDNTILIFLSDHGQRFGPLRETLIGWYEDKLPNMWILLSNRVKKRYLKWQEALEINSRRLTSTFAVFWTLEHILNTFTSTDSLSPVVKEDQPVARKYSNQNFLAPVPEDSSCKDVGVPDVYCGCYRMHQVQLNDSLLITAADISIQQLNSQLPDVCEPLKVKMISGGARIDKDSQWIYIVALYTDPGDILIEANIAFDLNSQSFASSSTFQRDNQITKRDVTCIKDRHWQLYCYCKRP